MTPTKPALHDFSPSESFERPASCCRSVSDEEFPPETETHLYDFQRVLLDARWARHKQRICSNSPVSCMPDELFSPGRPSPPVLHRNRKWHRPRADRFAEHGCPEFSLSKC